MATFTFYDALPGANFGDLFSFSETPDWYQLATGDGIKGEWTFVDTTLFNDYGKGWISALDLADLKIDFAQTNDTTLWVKPGLDGTWVSGGVDFSPATAGTITRFISQDTAMDRMFVDENVSPDTWYSLWIGADGTGGFVDTSAYNDLGRGWISADDLSLLTFSLEDAGKELWVQTWTPEDKSSDWESWTVEEPENLSLKVNDVTVSEGAGSVVFTVSLDKMLARDEVVTLTYATVDGTAVAGADYLEAAGTLTFTARETTRTVEVTLVDDTLADEGNETFSLGFSSDSPAYVVDHKSIATLMDDDTEPASFTLVADKALVDEGGILTYTITAVDEDGLPVVVSRDTRFFYTLADQDLLADVDHGSGQVALAAGESTVTFSLGILDDSLFEGVETLAVDLFRLAGTSPDTLISETGVPELTVDDISVAEDGGTCLFTLTLSNSPAPGTTVLVDYTTMDGTAVAEEDYQPVSGTLTFESGETVKTISVEILDDNIVDEGDETFTIALSNLTDPFVLAGGPATAVITDNDLLSMGLGVEDVLVKEDAGTMSFAVTLINSEELGQGESVSVDYATVSGTAVAGQDFQEATGTLTFDYGDTAKTIEVPIINDTVAREIDETFSIIFSNASDGLSVQGVTATGTISDDEGTPAPRGSEFLVNTFTPGSQTYPSVTSFDNGGFVVVWESSNQYSPTSLDDIYGQRYGADGARVGEEFLINTHTTGAQERSQVATLSNGGFVVVWESYDQDGSGEGVYGQIYDAGGAMSGQEFLINTRTTDNQFYPSVSAFEGGGFVVAWESENQDGSQEGIFAQRFSASGGKIGTEIMVNTLFENNQQHPSVITFPDNGFLVVWESYDQDGETSGTAYDIHGQRFSPGGVRVGNEFVVNTALEDWQTNPEATSLAGGGFVVVWESNLQDGSYNGVFGQCYDADGLAVGEEFQVNTESDKRQNGPDVVAFENGDFMVTWQSSEQDGSKDGIFGQHFAGGGEKLGDEVQLNAYANWNQHYASLAVLDDDRFVAAWDSVGQDGDEGAIVANVFSIAGTGTESIFSLSNPGNEPDQVTLTGVVNGDFGEMGA